MDISHFSNSYLIIGVCIILYFRLFNGLMASGSIKKNQSERQLLAHRAGDALASIDLMIERLDKAIKIVLRNRKSAVGARKVEK